LDENCLANTYTVKFDNGVVRNVPKSKISNLDRIDEGVLGRLKEMGSKLLDNIVKAAGRYLFCVLGDTVSNTLFNVMFKAETRNGIGFYPGKTFVQVCDEAGVEPTITEEDDIDEEENEAINAYWKEKIAAAQEAEDFTEDDIANESYRLSSYAGRMKYNRLFEADGIKLEAPEGGFENVNTKELQKMLVDQYRAFLFDGVGKPGSDTPIPYCIWGAPGIGKTQITKGIITKLQEAGFDANLIVVNARTMRKDDFALPGAKADTKKVKNAKGDVVDVDLQQARELIKEWLPMYNITDITDDVTAEMLDDVMNGGDGSGNGKGGFIFVDELSRIAPDVMEVFMGLVQDRQLGTSYLGSKWMFVFASNRISDMGDRGELVHWEGAYTGRFSHINFVPTFQEWLVWATGKDASGKQRIEPIIVDFLKEHPNMWYNSSMSNGDDDIVTGSMYPQARSWENVSKEMREKNRGSKAFSDDTDPSHDFQKTLYDMLGISASDREMNPAEMAAIVRHHAGNKPAQAFASWAGFDARYSPDKAAEVWTKGDKAFMNFQINSATVEKAIIKILANHPKNNGSKRGKIEITAPEMMNLMKFVIACADKIDGGSGDTKNQVLTAAYKTLALHLASAPFRIDLSNPADPALEKYEDALELYYENVSQAKNTAAEHYA
jgi:hypothetical protein